MRLAAALLLALLLTGCTALDAPPRTASPVASARDAAAAEAPDLTAFALASSTVPLAPIPVEISLSERWLKPFGAVEARAIAPAGARVAWFVEREDVEPAATVVDGEVYVLKSTTPDHHDADGPRMRIAVADLPADGRARTLRLPEAGRYQFEADGARLVVNVWPGAPSGAGQAFVSADDTALRFDPPELDVTPGARVLLWNHAGRALSFRETTFAAFVPLAPEGGRLTPIDEGLYVLSALGLGADGARGLARLAFLVDFERPSDALAAGPYAGRFLAAEGGAEGPARIGLRAELPLQWLAVRFRATSMVPIPSSVEVSLLDEGERALASASSLTTSEIRWGELPAGNYTLSVLGEHGAFVSYEIAAEGRYSLPMPDRLAKR